MDSTAESNAKEILERKFQAPSIEKFFASWAGPCRTLSHPWQTHERLGDLSVDATM
jgi:hypothetical protein